MAMVDVPPGRKRDEKKEYPGIFYRTVGYPSPSCVAAADIMGFHTGRHQEVENWCSSRRSSSSSN